MWHLRREKFVVDGVFCAAAKGKSSSGAWSRPQRNRRRCGDNGIAARVALGDPGQRSTMVGSVFSPVYLVWVASGAGTRETNQDRDGFSGERGV
jgi:hypothetical protein